MIKLNNKDTSKNEFIPLTNDYMFRAVFQKNQTALKGLISSVMHLTPEDIKSLTITNPIKLGESCEEKTFILDIDVLLNDDSLINLEMQMENEHNWQERSLSYLCRSFDQLYQGQDYNEAKPVTHIGFLNFSPFPDYVEFNATYKLLNVQNHKVYSDKFSLHVINLKHTELATAEDKAWKIDYWAQLFTATSWEELKMIADNNIYLEAASQTMYDLCGDELIKQQCRARRDYYKRLNTYNKMIHELEEKAASLQEKTISLEEKATSLENENASLQDENSSLQDKNASLQDENTRLKQRLAELESQSKQ